MPRSKKGPVASQLDIFDFDQTLTIAPTVHIKDAAFEHHQNIKAQLPLEHSDKKRMCAIASYHTNPELIMMYLETQLNKSMKLLTQIHSAHEVLSIYEVNGEAIPLVITTLPEDNYETHHRFHEQHGKNLQLKSIYDYLKTKQFINRKTKCDYYDDSENNIEMARKQFKHFKLHAHLVNKDNPLFEIIKPSKKPANRYRFHSTTEDEDKTSRSCSLFLCCC